MPKRRRTKFDQLASMALTIQTQASSIDKLIAALLGKGAPTPEPEATPEPAKGASKPRRLTTREREVARLIAHGLTNEQIAEQLVISYETVRAHRASAFKKLGVHNVTQLLSHPEAYEEPKGLDEGSSTKKSPTS